MFYSQRGFTLIEVLLAMIIISGIYYSVLIAIPKGAGRVESEAWRLVKGLQYINQKNWHERGIFGLRLSETHWRFYKFCCHGCGEVSDNFKIDRENNCVWQDYGENPLLTRELPEDLIYILNVYNEENVVNGILGENIEPQIIISPEDGYFDFSLSLKNKNDSEHIEIKSDISGVNVFIHK